ncbi:LSM2 [Candida pseudojiufengensis]|uniref:LSM2 n=1 Tax=Candida pseudojiufengensis TaxID=497109 RepID=UPI002224EF30|nr:LSM2 [Candida pseudojiufengensis]KAI5962218.1 LSM2 [Candida pseudojiufengensis]
MLFFSFFKTLVDQEVTVELKNDMEIKGTLKSVDQYLNLKLDNITCTNGDKYPYLQAVKNLFIRGSTVRYVHMSPNSVDCTLLQDASRRGMFKNISKLKDILELLRETILTEFTFIEAMVQASK